MTKNLKLEKDEFLLKEGEASSSLYWLQTGTMVATRKRNNEEVILGHIYSGELVGELSFLDEEPRSATVKALSECELIEIPHDTYHKIFEGQPKWFQILVKTLCERLRKANARIKV
ncbi:MAG: Crp/Fnr family transcriptional regulator [Bacteriovoracaceae bacterium]